MNPILQKIKEDKLRICQFEWCEDCPLLLAGYPDRRNIFTDIASELNVDKETRYRLFPSYLCGKDIMIHLNSDSKKWLPELDKLISEVSDMSFDESYDYILKRNETEIVELKKNMKSRLDYHNKYKNKPKNTCGCNGCE